MFTNKKRLLTFLKQSSTVIRATKKPPFKVFYLSNLLNWFYGVNWFARNQFSVESNQAIQLI